MMTRLQKLGCAQKASALVVMIGSLGLLGWLLHIETLKSLIPGLVTMKVNTALGLVLEGLALWFLGGAAGSAKSRRVSLLLAWAGAAMGALTLFEIMSGVDLGIDQLLSEAPAQELLVTSPGRMAPITALCFVAAGFSMCLAEVKNSAWRNVGQGLAVSVLLAAFIAICGYSYRINALYGVALFASMAIHTALGFLALAVGVLAVRPQQGLAAIILQDNSAGAALRRFLPAVVLTPFLLGWLRLEGQRLGFYGTEFGLALIITATTLILAIIALWNGKVQGQADEERKQSHRHDRFLLELSDLLHSNPEGSRLFMEVARRLGELLGVARCFFFEIESTAGQVILHPGFHGTLDPLPSVLRLETLSPETQQDLHSGKTVVLVDLSLDPRTAPNYQRVYRPMHVRSAITVPLFRGGHWAAGFSLTNTEPRAWQAKEVALLEATAERVWLWVDQARGLAERKRAEQERESLLAQLQALNSDLEDRVQTRTRELSSALKERGVLLQEVHHRVKNNLQVISSLINLQARQLTDVTSRAALEECQNRIHAIALIHQKLYQSKDYAEVPFSDYAKSLAANIFHANGTIPHAIRLSLAMDDVALSVDRAIPCGLILNELISNALKHAFPKGRRGVLTVGLRRSGSQHLILSVADNGVGLPADLDPLKTESLGMQLVSTLAEQLGGSLNVQRQDGTTFSVIFSLEEQP